MTSIIEVNNLGKRYPITHKADTNFAKHDGNRDYTEEFWALRDVTFCLEQGDRLGLVGRNGAGKSTLLKLLSRITSPTTGSMTIRGRVASLLEVGSGFHPELTGRENIYLNGAILGMAKVEIKRKFDEIVAFAEVEQFLDTPVKRYSSGMYARLAFAVAVNLDSEILIIDEVLSVGDAFFQKKCLEKINELAKQGRTILFVSHSVASITSFCTKGIVLSKGHMIYSGDTESAVKFHMEMGRKAVERGDLSHYRRDGYESFITSADSSDVNGNPAEQFQIGSDLCFSLSFDAGKHPALDDPVMGIKIFHSERGLVGTVTSRMSGHHNNGTAFRTGTMQCRLCKPHLNQGTYTVDLMLGDGAVILDEVCGYLALELSEADIYQSGRTPLADEGVVYFDAEWQ